MTGTRNVYATVAGSNNDDITRITLALDGIGWRSIGGTSFDPGPDGP